ncbi:MAG: ATP-binding protein [Chloracidobacterium sp.]|nr:ATP-binding protein [Chloracidobacterium sp.]
MKRVVENRIFATCNADEFVGREAELERLLDHATATGGLAMLCEPSAGASELLRQAYDRFFVGGGEVVPFYFEIKPSDVDAKTLATRFVREFLLQTVAFRRSDKKILDSSPEICELAELAVPADGYWIDRLVETCKSDSRLNDDSSFVRNCLSAPLRAAGHGAKSFVMIDGLDVLPELSGGESLLAEMVSIFSRGSVPYIFSGQRRFMFGRTTLPTMPLNCLKQADAGELVESLSGSKGVNVNDQTRDLIAIQLGGRPGAIRSLFAAAAEHGVELDTFERVQKSYTDEIFGGRIGRGFDTMFDRLVPSVELQAKALRLLGETHSAGDTGIPFAYWKKHLGLSGDETSRLLGRLNCAELIRYESEVVRADANDVISADRIAARIKIEGGSRALIIGEALAANIRRAPALMARVYRRNSALGLREFLAAFDGSMVSRALIDYGRFKDELKGADKEKIQQALNDDNNKIALPQIVYTANAAAFYPQLAEIADAERIAIALGTDGDGKEIAVIAAEVESKLEATLENANFWCDRLEMAAYHCGFENFKIWLIAPEGFAKVALEALICRNAYGSSRKQAALLAQILNAKTATDTAAALADEYEITVPMGEDTEMIAAHTIEDIAKRHNFPSKAINQIKTAVVEACINATEHSLSPDRKIHQKFAVDDEKIVITIANRGLRLADKAAKQVEPQEGRRGWGLKLMKGLMDDVRIEQSDDGTRITMTKFIKTA